MVHVLHTSATIVRSKYSLAVSNINSDTTYALQYGDVIN